LTNPFPLSVRIGNMGGDTLLEFDEWEIRGMWHTPLVKCVAERLGLAESEFHVVLGIFFWST